MTPPNRWLPVAGGVMMNMALGMFYGDVGCRAGGGGVRVAAQQPPRLAEAAAN